MTEKLIWLSIMLVAAGAWSTCAVAAADEQPKETFRALTAEESTAIQDKLYTTTGLEGNPLPAPAPTQSPATEASPAAPAESQAKTAPVAADPAAADPAAAEPAAAEPVATEPVAAKPVAAEPVVAAPAAEAAPAEVHAPAPKTAASVPGNAPEQPGLIIEFKNGVDAVSEEVQKINEFGKEDQCPTGSDQDQYEYIGVAVG